jgi:hypothetical protein
MPSTAGTKVKRSGVYSVIHYGHRAPHGVILQQGELFPDCHRCGTAVVFEFVGPLRECSENEHIGYDLDFMDSVLDRFRKAG